LLTPRIDPPLVAASAQSIVGLPQGGRVAGCNDDGEKRRRRRRRRRKRRRRMRVRLGRL